MDPLPPAHHLASTSSSGSDRCGCSGKCCPAEGESIYPRTLDLLIVDEAHNCAPSGRGKYATDSLRTQALRLLAPHFEHKLFLTATPHNGYPESFTALLELLDNQRFARGTPPDRKQLECRHGPAPEVGTAAEVGRHRPVPQAGAGALEVAYTDEEQAHPRRPQASTPNCGRRTAEDNAEKFATDFVLKTLKKRLFSSPAAFLRTLEQHENSLRTRQEAQGRLASPRAASSSGRSTGWTRTTPTTTSTTRRPTTPWTPPACCSASRPPRNWPCCKQMKAWAERASAQLDSKAKGLIRWLNEHIRPGRKWSNERVIIFTEYRATQNWLQGVLAAEGFTGGDRLLTMYGGMDSKDRERVKAAFQTDPEQQPGPHPAGHRRRPRGHRPPEPLLPADPLRDPVEPEPAGAAQRAHRPPRAEGEAGLGLPLRRQGLQRPGAASIADTAVGDLDADLEFLMRVVRKVETIREDLGKVGPVIAEQVEEAMLGRRSRLDTRRAETEGRAGAEDAQVRAGLGEADQGADGQAARDAAGTAAVARRTSTRSSRSPSNWPGSRR